MDRELAGRDALALACTRRQLGDLAFHLCDAPRIFSETSEMPQAYRETVVALANEELGQGERWEAARRDRYFELYGIFPS